MPDPFIATAVAQLLPTDCEDNRFMALALRAATAGLGHTWPNPSVGAVVVAPGSGTTPSELLSVARTADSGRPHAEPQALALAGERARGATLYVTLEPCAHHGRTPPCVDAIIAAGIERVVVGITDPDPRTAGQGLARLQATGVAVSLGVLAEEARMVTAGHITRITQGRPWVALKIAVGRDGRLAPGKGQAPVWVTGSLARARGHLMRARADAILIGVGTALADDPMLDCRLPGLADHSPIRVVLDTHARLPLSSKLAQTADRVPVWLMTAAPDSDRAMALAAHGVTIIPSATADGRIAISPALHALAERGITRVLVEGGPSLWRAMIGSGCADAVTVFEGAGEAGPTGLWPIAAGPLAGVLSANGFSIVHERRLADGDTIRQFTRTTPISET